MLRITGDPKPVIARLDEFKRRVDAGLRRVVEDTAEDVVSNIKENYLSGPRGSKLGTVTGRLRSSITSRVKQYDDRIAVTFGTDVPYAGIHEFGGQTPPRVILPREKGGVLSFLIGGRRVFAKSVKHPGSKIKKRPFMRPGVREMLPRFSEKIALFLKEAADHGNA